MSNDIPNVEDLLDSTLDDLEDLPSFEPFPAGVHRVACSLELKEVAGKQCVELSVTGIETVELADPTKDTPIKAGDTTSVLFMLDNEYGVGNLKKLALPIKIALFGEGAANTTREVIEAAKDVECVIVSSLRKDKNDTTKFYMNIKELEVV